MRTALATRATTTESPCEGVRSSHAYLGHADRVGFREGVTARVGADTDGLPARFEPVSVDSIRLRCFHQSVLSDGSTIELRCAGRFVDEKPIRASRAALELVEASARCVWPPEASGASDSWLPAAGY